MNKEKEIEKILKEFDDNWNEMCKETFKNGVEPEKPDGPVLVRRKIKKNKQFTNPEDPGNDGTIVIFQEYCEGDFPESSKIARRFKSAEKKSQGDYMTNHVMDKEGQTSLRVPSENSGKMNNFSTSWEDTNRFKCPECTVDIKYMDQEELDKRLEDGRMTPEAHREASKHAGAVIKKKIAVAGENGCCPYCGFKIVPNPTYSKGVVLNKSGKSKPKVKQGFTPGRKYPVFMIPDFVDGVDEIKPGKFEKTGEYVTIWKSGDTALFYTPGKYVEYGVNVREHPFNLERLNFTGIIHKKSSGQDWTGHLSADPEETGKHEMDVSITLKPNMVYGQTKKFVKDGIMVKQIQKVKYAEPCECGCMFKVYDSKRDETVCPECGIMFSRN